MEDDGEAGLMLEWKVRRIVYLVGKLLCELRNERIFLKGKDNVELLSLRDDNGSDDILFGLSSRLYK